MKSLVKKLVEVMKQVKYIQKTGFNDFHRYKYAQEADVSEKVREVLAEQNVVMIPNVKTHTVREHINAKGKTEYIVTVEVEFTFIDGDTGETITFTMYGEGQDAGDKGTYKAITGAQKYALMKAFMIPTGDDPEADKGVDERNADSPVRGKSDDLEAIERESKLRSAMTKWKALSGEKDAEKARESFVAFLSEKGKSIDTVTVDDLIKIEELLAKRLLARAQEQKKGA